ncbi:O-GlcNAcase NagJ precursor [Paraliobacillus sp. PM-2]|uniref:discoidin domain-containing protein n=1 Tax=Paraliobacillus sp. PM-2 TaxID=1462524 RepID=UPI00061CBF78|nr:discoidin domain-containing protein [Paraliobacillus sp. PM-2]CQR46154.1 O-GlcNAcase NagJ precursor [Paraliobacillus sp. PM-2]
MKNYIKKIAICFIAVMVFMPSLLTNFAVPIHAVGDEPIFTASGSEMGSTGPEKAFDGLYNRYDNPDSRWSSEASLASEENPKWLQVEYPEQKTFEGFKIHWERINVNAYRIEVSTDGDNFETVYDSTTNKKQWIETVKLDEAVTAKVVRLVITDFDETAPNIDKSVTWPTVSVYEFEVLENLDTVVVGTDNVAVGKEATASNEEAGTDFVASNTIDGDLTTRWSTDKSEDITPRTLTIDLQHLTQLQSVIINWERENPNIIAFDLSYSEDNEQYFPIYEQTEKSGIQRQIVNLQNSINARYIKLHVTEYDGGSSNWPNVGVNEVEAFSTPVEESPDEITSLNQITTLSVNEETGALDIPQASNGTISVVGSNAQPVIDLNGNVFEPLTDKDVKVTLELTKSESTETKEFTVSVKGKYDNEGTNEKPKVIPALQEWYGLEGMTTVDTDTTLVVKDASFTKAAEIFKQDLVEMEDLDLTIGTAETNAIIFQKDEAGVYGEEGYHMEVKDGNIVITAEEYTGAFYATRTLLQQLKLSETNELPNGLIRDYPKYKVRGFMLDVGRKFTDLEYMYQYMKNMSYYKMNDFQVHLNDNELEMDLYGSIENAIENAYAGFRLESDIVGENGVALTSEDGYYTKEEFSQFITDAGNYGVDIVPEFDTPGHALSMVKVRPELHYKGEIINNKPPEEAAAMLDLSHPDTMPFIKSIYNEYLDGSDPVFQDMPIHIGSDEYYGEAEAYRAYADEMLKFIRDEKNHTVRLWGSLSNKTGSTPVTSKDVQMQVWNTWWANPNQMLEQGYDIINIDDGQIYIVPRAGYYNDRLNPERLYNNYQPNKFSNGTIVNESSPQFLGGMFALWNDKIGKLENGITTYDMFDRIFEAIPVMAQKNWGSSTEDMPYASFAELAQNTNLAPETNPFYEVPTVEDTVLDYDFSQSTVDQSKNGYDIKDTVNADVVEGQGLQLHANESYVTTGLTNLGPSAVMNVTLTLDDTDGTQILAETVNHGLLDGLASEDYATLYAVNEDGYVGYDFGNLSYSFNHKLVAGEQTTLTFITDMEKTRLLVNGDEVALTEDTSMPYNTLVLPLERIGSATDALDGTISTFNVTKGKYIDPTKIDPSTMTITASSEEKNQSNTSVEGPIELAFDNDTDTIWHSEWDKNPPLPYEVNLELSEETNLDKFLYTPRKGGADGAANGLITAYRMEVSTDGENYQEVASGNWEANSIVKNIDLNGVNAKYVRFIVEDGVNGFASAAEFSLHTPDTPEPVEPVLTVKDATIKAGESLDLRSLITEATDEAGEEATEAVVIDEGDYDASVPGTYTITYTLGDVEQTATVTVEEADTPEPVEPVLTVKDATIKAGDSLDLRSLITEAADEAGEEATEAVVIDEGDYDASVPGTYTITYTLGDVEQTATVTVEEADTPDPVDPGDSDDSDDSTTDKEESDQDSNQSDSEEELPETSTSIFNSLFIGLILLVIGGAAFVLLRRRSHS